jgi:ABC-2 type transport system ATP-binding protein
VGLDPNQIREIRQLIRELGDDHGVILSTHILPEVQATCDRVQIINKGRLALNDTLEGLNARMQANSLTVAFRRAPDIDSLLAVSGIETVEPMQNNHFAVHVSSDSNPAEAISKLAVEHDWGLLEMTPQRLSLEQIFMDITCKDDFQGNIDEVAGA